MPNSTRYFQLTQDILLEYRYSDVDIRSNQEGDVSDYIFDMLNDEEGTFVIKDNYDGSKNFVFGNDVGGLVMPMNTSESRFVQYNEESSNNYSIVEYNELNDNNCDVIYDTIRVHFTSGAYFEDYDGLILRGYIYDRMKNKISLFSHIIRKTDDVEVNENPMLINQKLYTTYLDFRLPSANALVNVYKDTAKYDEIPLRKALRYRYELMENTPLVFNIYGIRTTYKDILDRDEKYIVEKLNSIYVPIKDSFNNITIDIKESDRGDFFEIRTLVTDRGLSFCDYINELSNGHPEIYIILHELSLIENYVPAAGNEVISTVTHREHYIVKGGDDNGKVNEPGLQNVMRYRPIIMNSGTLVSFTIEDQMKIINTYDNTTVVKTGSQTYTIDGCNPRKYGLKMNRLNFGGTPKIVNVYNRRMDDDLDTVRITNSGNASNVKIENHQHSITSFIECINVGVTIEQVPVELIEMQ